MALVPGLSACLEPPTAPDIRDVDFADTLDVDIDTFTETDSGVFYKDLVVGDGALASFGSTVEVAVTGWLTNGTEFQPRLVLPGVKLGDNVYIAGLEIGVTGMKVGGTRRIVVPPTLAYGLQGTGTIPSNAILIFELELLAVA